MKEDAWSEIASEMNRTANQCKNILGLITSNWQERNNNNRGKEKGKEF